MTNNLALYSCVFQSADGLSYLLPLKLMLISVRGRPLTKKRSETCCSYGDIKPCCPLEVAAPLAARI